MGLSRVAQVQRFAFFNQRANPIHLAALGHLGADALDHLVAARLVHHLGDDGRAPRRQLVQGGHVQVGVVAHGQGARNGRGRHHQQMRLQAGVLQFVAQGQALRHAKAVLLVNHRQRQVFELHLGLDDGVRAHHQLGLATLNEGQHGAPLLGLLRASQPGGGDA